MAAGRGYDQALKALGSLISGRRRPDGKSWADAFEAMPVYLERLGLRERLGLLSVIHVAGTKGKGSTCSMAESILRRAGYKTGLFTSPHLVDVRERIRIGGRVCEKETFLRNFWVVWDKLESNQTETVGMPAYFRFLTLLGFQIFLDQGVDVAVIEVGLGGRLDATNVLERPKVSGVASLGFDHTALLGNTLREIAAEKAGIFKPGVPAFTVPQEQEAMDSLGAVAERVGTPLVRVPALSEYAAAGGRPVRVGLEGKHQETNAALAVALCQMWEAQRASTTDEDYRRQTAACLGADKALSEAYLEGLAQARWPGRSQVVRDAHEGSLTFFLDGAHTPESVVACGRWFAEAASADAERVMVFHCMDERDHRLLLSKLHAALEGAGVGLAHALFVPLNSSLESLKKYGEVNTAWTRELESASRECSPGLPSDALGSIDAAVAWLRKRAGGGRKVEVLVTGSLYLVGDVLKNLEVDLE